MLTTRTGMAGISSNGGDFVWLWVQVDGTCARSGDAFDKRSFALFNGQTMVSTQYVAASRSAASHTFRLCATSTSVAGGAVGASITAQTVATSG